jgi:CRISPR/Cas system-associated protein Cas7 (RAMP superfamily)
MKLQVSELAELIERNDVGDFSGFGINPPGAGVRRTSYWRLDRTVPRQPEISFES